MPIQSLASPSPLISLLDAGDASALNPERDMKLVGTAHDNCTELESLLRHVKPDIVIVDGVLGRGVPVKAFDERSETNGMNACQRVRRAITGAQIIFHTQWPELFKAAINTNCIDHIMPKTLTNDEIRKTIRQVYHRQHLGPLPAQSYQFAEWKKARVNIDYHIEIDRHYYSVPYALLHRELDARYTAMTVEIFHRGQRIASHARSSRIGGHTTIDAHRPKSHQRYLEWTPERLVRWASTIGPFTATLVDKILQSRPHPEQGFRSCLGILRLGKTYGSDRLEAASARACNLNACSYQSVKSILRTGLDRQSELEPPLDRPPIQHTNIRGTDYFNPQEEPSC